MCQIPNIIVSIRFITEHQNTGHCAWFHFFRKHRLEVIVTPLNQACVHMARMTLLPKVTLRRLRSGKKSIRFVGVSEVDPVSLTPIY